MYGRPKVVGFTLDPEDAPDLDDAIYVVKHSEGWTLMVHIADVAERVRMDSQDDRAAARRAFSLYRLGGTRHMLPKYLAEDQLSLLPGVIRDTVTFTIQLGNDLTVKHFDAERTELCSAGRLSYHEVERILDDPSDPRNAEWRSYFELAKALAEKRHNRGAITRFDPAHGIMSDEEGGEIRDPAGRGFRGALFVQELMILTNQLATDWVYQHGSMIVRNHSPDSEEAENCGNFLDEVGNELNWIGRARYSTFCTGHYGLRLERYGHWTSPIRRYADLVNQRILVNLLEGLPIPYSDEELEEIIAHINSEADKLRRRLYDATERAAFLSVARAGYESLMKMPDDDFCVFLQCLSTEILNLTDPRIKAIRGRLEEGRLTDRHLAFIVLNPGYSRVWLWLKSIVLDQILHGDRHSALEILRHWPDVAKGPALEELEWERTFEGGRHRAKITASLYGRPCRSGLFLGDTAAQAEHFAACGLLSRVNNMPYDTVLPEPMRQIDRKLSNEPLRLLERPPENSPLSRDAGQRLHILARRNGVDEAKFDFEQGGEGPHAPFTCVGNFSLGGVLYVSDPCTERTKKAARASAEWNLLAKLPPEVSRMKQSETDAAATGS